MLECSAIVTSRGNEKYLKANMIKLFRKYTAIRVEDIDRATTFKLVTNHADTAHIISRYDFHFFRSSL